MVQWPGAAARPAPAHREYTILVTDICHVIIHDMRKLQVDICGNTRDRRRREPIVVLIIYY